jgi:hypothetical protein
MNRRCQLFSKEENTTKTEKGASRRKIRQKRIGNKAGKNEDRRRRRMNKIKNIKEEGEYGKGEEKVEEYRRRLE